MKTRRFQKISVAVATGGLALLAWTASAQTIPDPTAQILQLERAKISDDTIIAYIQNSGNTYNLDANQIISLRQQGVSDGVIRAMLNRSQPGAAPTPSAAAAPAAPAPPPADASATTSTVQVPTATVAPTVTYVQTAPTDYYYRYPYYYAYPYYGWAYPGVSLSFGWYGGWHGGGGHGGWHH